MDETSISRFLRMSEVIFPNWIFILSILLLNTPCTWSAIIHVTEDYLSIQEALNAANSGDTILVASGTYLENIFWPDTPNLSLISEEGSEVTILDGQMISRVILVGGNGCSDVYINGFTIQNGFAEDKPGLNPLGGGFFSTDADIFMSEVIIENNRTDAGSSTGGDGGGGVFIQNGHLYLTNSIIRSNSCIGNYDSSGGGILLYNCQAWIVCCQIENNTVSSQNDYPGAGLASRGVSFLFLDSNQIVNNNSNVNGSGIDLRCPAKVINNFLIGNNNGAATFWNYSVQCLHNTFVDNNGVCLELQTNCHVCANIFLNSPVGIFNGSGYTSELNYNDFWNIALPYQNISPGPTDFMEDPILDFKYKLIPSSPCIDRSVDEGIYWDADRDPRPLGLSFDVGADECIHIPQATPTMTPSSTPTSIYSVTPTASPKPSGVELSMPSYEFHPKDSCYLYCYINNEQSDFLEVKLHILLGIQGVYYYVLQQPAKFFSGRTLEVIIPEFSWPYDVGNGEGIFYAGLTDMNNSEIIGETSMWSFRWSK